MIKKITIVAGISILLLVAACKTPAIKMNAEKKEKAPEKKIVVYQVFTRLFGNKNTQRNIEKNKNPLKVINLCIIFKPK